MRFRHENLSKDMTTKLNQRSPSTYSGKQRTEKSVDATVSDTLEVAHLGCDRREPQYFHIGVELEDMKSTTVREFLSTPPLIPGLVAKSSMQAVSIIQIITRAIIYTIALTNTYWAS